MSDAAAVARALGGHPASKGYLCRCPVPGHGKGQGDRHPSLLVRNGRHRLLVRCFGGCDSTDVLDELRRRGILARVETGLQRGGAPRRSASSIAQQAPDPAALQLWGSVCPVTGTLAERYLRQHRALAGPFPATLGFCEATLHRPTGQRLPALVAAVQAPDGLIGAVQVTFLAPADGRKARLEHPRWTVGSLGVGAVRLAHATDELGLAEGVEDALAAAKLTGVPAWAVLGATRMDRVAVPPAVRQLHIFADDDDPGRKAAERTAGQHLAAGRRVIVRLPPRGAKDWNDFLRLQIGKDAA